MSELVKHTLLDSGIHHMVWLDNSVDAVIQYRQLFMSILENVFRNSQLTEDEPVLTLFLSDYRHTSFPEVQDVVPETVDSRRRNAILFYRIACRFAYLSNDVEHVDKVSAVSRLMPRSFERRFFKSDEEELAIAWLLT